MKKSEQSQNENKLKQGCLFVMHGKISTKIKSLCISNPEAFFYNTDKWQECQKE